MSNAILRVKSRIKTLFTSALFLFFYYPDSYGKTCNQSVTSEAITISTSEQQTTNYSKGRSAIAFDAYEGNTLTSASCNTTTGYSELMTSGHVSTMFINVDSFIEWFYNYEASNKKTCSIRAIFLSFEVPVLYQITQLYMKYTEIHILTTDWRQYICTVNN